LVGWLASCYGSETGEYVACTNDLHSLTLSFLQVKDQQGSEVQFKCPVIGESREGDTLVRHFCDAFGSWQQWQMKNTIGTTGN